MMMHGLANVRFIVWGVFFYLLQKPNSRLPTNVMFRVDGFVLPTDTGALFADIHKY